MGCYFTIMEVSQKQSYIFESDELKDNITASDLIFYITSSEFLEQEFSGLYKSSENLVYDGGGHIILTYKEKEKADEIAKAVSRFILEHFELLEIFVNTIEYRNSPVETRNALMEALEKKKSRRKASFRQGLFGIEYLEFQDKEEYKQEIENRTLKERISKKISGRELKWIEPYEPVRAFKDLGGRRNESNFIAVVHIDGNQMGRRVGTLDAENQNMNLEEYRKVRQKFSAEIVRAYEESYQNMLEAVKHQIETGTLNDLILESEVKGIKKLPVRKIIMAGDDVCFVTEGRIGIECAVTFLKELWTKKNEIDGENYSACAGVAIVHEKYPFFKAYELAERLCSNAKRSVAERKTAEGRASAIDWHIELGEIYGDVQEIRDQYRSGDGEELYGRPYCVCEEGLKAETQDIPKYREWKKLVHKIKHSEDASARGKLKGFYQVLKQGKHASANYVEQKLLMDIVEQEQMYLFDAIEAMDYFISFEGVDGCEC